MGLDATLKLKKDGEVVEEVEFNCKRYVYAVEYAIKEFHNEQNNGKDVLIADTLFDVMEKLEEVMMGIARECDEDEYKPYEVLNVIKEVVRKEEEYEDVKLYIEYWF